MAIRKSKGFVDRHKKDDKPSTPSTPNPTTPKKYALRRLKRMANGQVQVVFVDADTGQELTSLSGYELLDGGNPSWTGGTDTPTPTPTDDNHSSGGGSGGGFSQEPDNWTNRPGASKGTGDIVKDFSTAFGRLKQNLEGIRDQFVYPVKKAIQDTAIQVTGNPDLYSPEETNKTPVNSSGPSGKDEGFAYNTPPSGYTPPSKDPSSKGSQELDARMAYESGPIPTGEVAKGVSYANQGATRNKLVNETVITDLSAVVNQVNPNLTVQINSGGQEPLYITDDYGRQVKNPAAKDNVNRIAGGTVNHDVEVTGETYALDAQFFLNGKQITPKSDPAIFKEIAKYWVVAGGTQVGMEGNVVHLGKDPNDTYLRTWGYPKGNPLPAALQTGVNEGLVLKKQQPDLYPKMLAAVDQSMANSTAPFPATQGANNPAVAAASKLRESFGLEPLATAVSGTQDALVGLMNGIGAGMGSIGQQVAANMETPQGIGGSIVRPFNDIYNMVNGDNGLFGAGKTVANKTIDAMRGQIMPAISEGARNIQSALQNTKLPNVGGMVADAVGNIGNMVGGFMSPQQPQAVAASTVTPTDTWSIPQGFAPQGFYPGLPGITTPPPSVVYPNASLLDALSDPQKQREIVGTVIGESIGEGPEGWIGVANTIKNRALELAMSPDEVVKQPSQYNGYGSSEYNNPNNIPGTPAYEKVLDVVTKVFSGEIPDNTNGATDFHANYVNPGWGPKKVAETGQQPIAIGNHLFYPQYGAHPQDSNVAYNPPITGGQGFIGAQPSAAEAAVGRIGTGFMGDRYNTQTGTASSSQPASLYNPVLAKPLASTSQPQSLYNPVLQSTSRPNENLGSNVRPSTGSNVQSSKSNENLGSSVMNSNTSSNRPATGSNTQSSKSNENLGSNVQSSVGKPASSNAPVSLSNPVVKSPSSTVPSTTKSTAATTTTKATSGTTVNVSKGVSIYF